jgi:DNA-binding NarL/FixJ family response regulator
MIRVLIADDQNLIRQALQVCLEPENDIEIIACVDDGLKAIDRIEKFHPDVAILDLEMPNLDGLTTTRIICERFPQTRVLVLSSHDSEDYVNQALKAGAKGYLNKTTSTEELANAIRSVHKGYLRLAPELQERLLNYLNKDKENPNIIFHLEEKITERFQNIQQEVRQILDSEHNVIREQLTQLINEKSDKTEQDLLIELETDVNNLKQEVEQGLKDFQHKVFQQMQEYGDQIKALLEHKNFNLDSIHEQQLMRIQLMQVKQAYQKLEEQLDLAYKLFFVIILAIIAIMIVVFCV